MVNPPNQLPSVLRTIKPGFAAPLTDVQRLFVVAFDPGVTTGWFVARVCVETLVRGGLRGLCLNEGGEETFSWRAGKFTGPEPWQAELMMALVRGTWMYGFGEFGLGSDSDLFVVVGEGFKARMIGDDATVLSPVRLQAMFRCLSWRAPFPFVLASIRDAMEIFTDARLQNFRLWSGVAGRDGEHQRDATRYGALIIRKCADVAWLAGLEARMPWLRSVE